MGHCLCVSHRHALQGVCPDRVCGPDEMEQSHVTKMDPVAVQSNQLAPTNKQQTMAIFDRRLTETGTSGQQTPCALTIRVPALEEPHRLRRMCRAIQLDVTHEADGVQRGDPQDTRGTQSGPKANG